MHTYQGQKKNHLNLGEITPLRQTEARLMPVLISKREKPP